MKRKFLIGLSSLLVVIFTISLLITIVNANSPYYQGGSTEWFIENDNEQGIRWYYEVVDGEAVNVRTTGSTSAKKIKKLVVPQTLGGYPVTKVSGESGWMGAWICNVLGATWDSLPLVEEVVLPEGLKVIGTNSFRDCVNLKKINLPSTLEKIEGYSFHKVELDNLVIDNPNLQLEEYLELKVKNLEIKNIETCNLTPRFGGINAIESLKVEGVKNLVRCAICEPDTEVTISSDVETISRYAISGATDAYVDKIEDEVNLIDYTLNGSTGIVYHFKNAEKIKTNLPEGIKAIDVNKNEEFTVKKVGTGSDFTFKLEQEAGYNYEDYAVFIEDVENYDVIEGKIGKVQRINARFGEEYTIENITGYKKIHVQLRKDIFDLHLNQYIWGINDIKLNNSREPVAQIQEDRTINYQTNKNDLYVKYGDKVRYGVRVYNEGTKDGTANKITVQIPEGLIFNQESEINTQYGWEISADGRTATTEYLNNKTIKAYTLYNKVEYEEIFIDLDVEILEETADKTLQTIARITETSEEEGDIGDNIDTETVKTTKNETHPFDLVVNKIDGIDNALLNGATFDLLDENKKVIKTGVTANGGKINFGTVYAYGDKRTRYYIKETYTPEGYKNHLKYLIRLDVVPTYSDIAANNRVDFELDIHDIDIDTSKYETIEISSKEELRAIENNLDKKYVLVQDIDLDGENWEPLNVENVMLDGQGHKISNLKIEGDAETNKKVGLFATYSGIIENLILEDVDISITKNITTNEVQVESNDAYINGIYQKETTEDDIPAIGGIIGYSKDVILKGCKVTGNLNTEFKNIGGLVGHSKIGTLTVFRDCINEADVTASKEYEYEYKYNEASDVRTKSGTEGRNAGGMIGTSLGPVYVSNCRNTGSITVGKYNAGGMIGAAECEEYNSPNVFGQCDNSLNIYVKNERIKGKYKIEINKIDESEKRLLTGAKFSVYDRNKAIIPGLENVELTNGILEIPETIDTIGTDTFYIKETKAPIGYVKLTDTYIKIEVEKTWNKEEQKYETQTNCITLTENEMENDIAKSANISEVATGLNITNTNNSNVTLKTNDVTIDQNTVNEGTVISNNIDAGGFIGHATCSVEVTDSSNNGNVCASKGNAAGIVGQIVTTTGSEKLLYVNNTNNNGIIKQFEEGYSAVSIAGIAGVISSNAEIYNTNNSGKIEVIDSSMAGIIGTSYSDVLTIDNCENTGNLIGTDKQAPSSSNNGGIIGKSFSVEHFKYDFGYTSLDVNITKNKSEHKITNCKNSGTFVVNSHTGGIIGKSGSKNLEVANCTVNDTTINSYGFSDVGGIVGNSVNEIINVHDNEINNLKVNMSANGSSYGSTGGVLGMAFASNMGDDKNANQTIKINNCKVKGIETVTYRSTGGILGAMINSKGLYIENSDVEGATLRLVGGEGTSNQIAGIAASITSIDLNSDRSITIKNCNVDNSNIYEYNTQGDIGISGAIGNVCSISNNPSSVLECKDIKVSNTNIMNLGNRSPSNTMNAAGIAAHVRNTGTVTFENTDLDNVKIEAHSAKVGGTVASVYAATQLNIINCDSDQLTIDNTVPTVTPSCYQAAGIIADEEATNANISDCDITNASITTTTQAAGAVAWANGKIQLDNVNLEGSTITGLSNVKPGEYNIAGLITVAMSEATINKCLVKDCTITSPCLNTSGMISDAHGALTMTDCEVNNTKVENKYADTQNSISASAGMVSRIGSGVAMTNCRITNGSQILSKCASTGGLIGYVDGTARLTKCSADNISITTDKMTGKQQDVGGLIGIAYGAYLNECSVTGNTTINSVATSAGGIAGTTKYLYECKDCKVEDVTINNGAAANYAQYTGVAGMIGTTLYNTNLDIENAKVKNVSLTTSSDSMSGVIGYGYFNNIKNSEIENITFNHTNTVGHSNSSGRGVSGISVYPNVEATIQASTIKNITMNIASGSIPYISAGGLYGYSYRGIVIDENTEISDINITNNTYGSTAGIIANHCSSDKLYIPKLENFDNITVKGKQNAGAIAAFSYGKIEVGELSGNNITVEGENYVGGLFGTDGASSYNWKIENVTLSNVEVSGKGNVGGILGGGLANSTLPTTTLNNINMSNVKVNNTGVDLVAPRTTFTTTKTYNHTGGIIGNVKKATISNINLTDIEVKLNETDEENVAQGNLGGVVGNVENNLTLNEITINTADKNENIVNGNANYIGALLGYGKVTTENVEINDVEVNSEGTTAIGTIGFVVSGSDVKDIHLTSSKITANGGYVGGIVGMANDNIESCTVTDSEIIQTGLSSGTGGILGHGSNTVGTDVTIKNSKVIDSKIIGNDKVGGISGGAVYKIQNCYVGGKENETFAEGEYAVEITGNEGVGTIIGDAGLILNDETLILQMLSNTVKDTKVTRVERPLETGEMPDIYGMIGMHNRFTETYSRDETENLTGNIASNCEVVNVTNP